MANAAGFVGSDARSDKEDALLWERFAGKPGAEAKASPGHRLTLSRSVPDGFGLHLRSFLPPDPMRGEAILNDRWRIGQKRVIMSEGRAPWTETMPSRHFADRLHRFDWLGDVFAQGEVGADRARYLIDDWIENFGRFDGFAWRLSCTADRVWNWLACGANLFEVGDEDACQARLESVTRQIRHINALGRNDTEPNGLWRSLVIGVVFAICLQRGKGLDDAFAQLESECTAQFFADGGHVSRSPSRGLSCLADLISIQDLLERSDRDVPDFLTKRIERVGGMVAFFQVGDGALTPFNDGAERRPETVEAIMARLPKAPRRFSIAPKSGFHKLEKDGRLLVLDAGHAPEVPFGDLAHAGALGFELHDGQSRIVTSCGCSPEVDVDFQAAVRRTSAHSTVILENADSSNFVTNDATGLLCPVGPDAISAKRLEEASEIWLDAQHGGFKAEFGLLHRRRLFMSGDGTRLTGEDSLARPVSAGQAEEDKGISYAIRFHLHPTVSAVTIGDAILLTCEDGPKWRFKTSHSRAMIESTIYLGRGIVEQAKQIVLRGKADANSDGSAPPNCVRWAFLRVGRT